MNVEVVRRYSPLHRITVKGFKSLGEETHLEIKPLTILAGANSSGKSSIMQPLLLMKQTLEASGDYGALKLDGPCARFSKVEQMLTRVPEGSASSFSVTITHRDGFSLRSAYRPAKGYGVEVYLTEITNRLGVALLETGMTSDQIREQLFEMFRSEAFTAEKMEATWRLERTGCFLRAVADSTVVKEEILKAYVFVGDDLRDVSIKWLIHLPGLRTRPPERAYPRTAVPSRLFPGIFDIYTASLIEHWATEDAEKYGRLCSGLASVGLTWTVVARAIDDTRIELKVGRLPKSANGKDDLVDIADVGVGVSQVLPVIVALIAAEPGQLVYIEQPEIHLHPRAQRKLAELMCEAANRGVLLVAETHSPVILREIQTLVAKDQIAPGKVSMNWFTRDPETGLSTIHKAELDENGAYGNWPVDFDEVDSALSMDYIKAVEKRLGIE